MQLNTLKRSWTRVLALVSVGALALLVASCGGDGDPSSIGNGPTSELSGTIEIDGSSTVFPISLAVAEEFKKVHPKVRPNVGVSGTGGGFKRFVDGETAISNASRPIKESEAAKAKEKGIEYLELRVAIDGLSVTVSNDNDLVDCLTVDELKMIWEPGSAVDSWDDVRPEWPDRRLRLYGPGTDSGTFDYFTEEIVGEARASRSDFTASEDDNVLVRGIAGDRNSLGYFGYSYYTVNAGKLKLVAIDNHGAGCVAPSGETIERGVYTPLSRPLFIYVNLESLQKPEVKAFVEFYMEEAAELAREVGYVPLSPEVYQQNLEAVTGS